MKTYKILIVDDHQIVLDGLVSVFKEQEKFKIVAIANNGKEALEILKNQKIDVLLTDVQMENIGGIELTIKAKQLQKDICVVALSMFNDNAIISELKISGANGYVLKNAGKETLINALEKVVAGDTFFPTLETQNVKLNSKDLTDREVEILRLVCDGKSSVEIGEELFISPRTVEVHRRNLLIKTDCKNVAELIKFALKMGISS